MVHLHVISTPFICRKGFFGHVHFSDCDGESQNSCRELPNYYANVLQNAKQGNLDGANVFGLFHDVTKDSEGEAHGVKAIEIASNDKSSVVFHRSRHAKCDHSQYQCDEVNY